MCIDFNIKSAKNLFYIILLVCTSCGEPKPPQVTFDVPALFKMNIDEIRKVLGKPLYHPIEPSNPKEVTFSNEYRKNGVYISFDFNTKSRRISRITLISQEEYDKIEDVMKVGNLTSTNKEYYDIVSYHPFDSTPPFRAIRIYIR